MSPLTARWNNSKGENTIAHHAGLSITVCSEVNSCIKGRDIYTMASILQGLWFLVTLGLRINVIISLPTFAYLYAIFSLAWKIPLFFLHFFFFILDITASSLVQFTSQFTTAA